MNMDISVVGIHQVNSLLQVPKLKQNLKKINKVVTVKTPFVAIGQFCTHHYNCLNIDF